MGRIQKSTCLALSLVTAALAENPVISHRHLADPNGFVYNGRLYAITSNDDENKGGYDMLGSVLISTKDFVNWSDHGEVYYSRKDTKWAGAAYAPTAIPRDGKIFYYIPNNAGGVGVLVADKPEGPLKDPLGKGLITGSLCDGVAWCFDPDIFVDDDGQAYLVWGGGSNTSYSYGQNIRIIKVNRDMISVSGSPIKLSLEKSFEGPFLHKYKGNYYLHYPMSGGANIGCSMSSSPTSGYKYIGSILDNPSIDGKNVNMGNNSHESIFEYEGSWYMMYHDRRLTISLGTNNYLKRSVNIDKLTYKADGTINKVIPTKGIAQLRNFDPYDSIPAVTYSKQSGISAYTDVNNSGIQRINLLVPRKSGSWMRISSADFGTAGAKQFVINGGGKASNATVEIRAGSETGTLAGTCKIANTGSWTTLTKSICDLTGLSGVKDVYLKFQGTDSNAVMNWWRFVPANPVAVSRPRPSAPGFEDYQIFDIAGREVLRFTAAETTRPTTAWMENCGRLPVGTYIARRVGANKVDALTFVKP